ncbi:MAG: PQQ-binding-like beta-propeller repeat protein [Bdellovibrionales bacterium]|nr:PQQ-binding-like beta-propeller repeat protein [Bdellovibrionales bacterium]
MTFGLLAKGKLFFQENREEIQNSPVLRKYGFLLSLIHFFTFSYWFFVGEVYNYISKATPGVCQPFLQFCESYRFGNPILWRWILVFYFIIGAIGSVLWLRKSISLAYSYSYFVLLFKIFIYVQDYRLMGNFHYIHFIFILLFLLVPRKIQLIPISIVLIYLGAGLLKLNSEWISGSALYGDIGPLKWIPIQMATIYVIVLELGFSSLLLSRHRFWQKFALFQFFVFHIYSIQIVGLFYPAVMFCILSIFILMSKEHADMPSIISVWRYKPHRTLSLLFILAQIYPLILPGKSALTGEGRLVSLNMFDARAVCRHTFVVDRGMGHYVQMQLNLESFGTRIRCEPYVYLEFARRLCEDYQKNNDFAVVDIHMQSRLSSEQNFQPIVDINDVCKKEPHFNPFWANSWIKKSVESEVEISPWKYQESKLDPNNSPAMYRENPQRTGVVETKELIHPMSRPIWRKPNWNDSRHSASKSSPISDGKMIYAGSDQGFFSAMDLTGREVWRWVMSANRGVHGTAMIVGESVFWGDYDGILYSANKGNGKPNWLLPLGQTIGSSPLYSNGAIFVSVETFSPPDGFVTKIDAKTGKMLWKSSMLGEQAHSSPALSEDGSLIFVGSNNGYINAIDSLTGKIVWKYATGLAVKGTPMVVGDSVTFCSWDKNIYKLKASTGDLLWNSPLEGSCQSSPTWSKKEDAVYISTSSGRTVAFNFSNGREMWRHQGSGVFFSSPVLLVKDGVKPEEELVAGCFERELCIFNSKKGDILRRINLGDRLSSVPWFENGEMTYSLDTSGGLVQWK